MIKKLLILLSILIIVVIGALFYVKNQVQQYIEQPIMVESPQLLTVSNGMTLRSALHKMEKQKWLKSIPFSRLLPRLYPELVRIKAGTFQITPNQSLQSLLAMMVAGKEHQFSITFIEGSRFSEWLLQLKNAQELVHKTSDMTEAQIADYLGEDKAKLEGLLLAETYHYTSGMSDLEILSRAHRALKKELERSWESRSNGLPLKTPYEALILASIIEKETAIESERRRVASVFVNRLNKHMRLQTDPTVIYGIGDKYDGNITRKDLKTPTDYNTYVIYGLPPTPIAMPGVESIRAALNPEQSNYLYFVASGNGGHIFTKSLVEHNRAVRNYLKTLKANKNK
ncbi:endolytic transglycosylase MltG [Vibrio sp. S17_S38]|uniref:endolytic transglycosylase MltG n=1 Tax=Vibrio sp. S17_S38 TaxID=2720229 RepID=UPI0016805DD5|nr:endolytic transglycosylase MltG [Vibrio sp. S17_S38]